MFLDYHKESSFSDNNGNNGNNHKIHIDTARIYSGGKTENILGSVLRQLDPSLFPNKHDIVIGSKAHPSYEQGGLSPRGLRGQLQTSIDAVHTDRTFFGEYYLHQPDTSHSLLESLTCIHQMVTEGQIQSFGMSNYHATEMKRTFELCETHGLTKPTVCQSLYNPLNREVEHELIPLLRANGCSFVAYNPLAAGLLTGKHPKPQHGADPHNAVMEGRFKNNPNYLPRFYTEANFDALQHIQDACDKEHTTVLEATFQWLLRHSALTPNDGILLGASSTSQLRQNLDACRAAEMEGDGGCLSEGVRKAFDEAAEIARRDAFPYWRSYSADMPGRELMDGGASYQAKKA